MNPTEKYLCVAFPDIPTHQRPAISFSTDEGTAHNYLNLWYLVFLILELLENYVLIFYLQSAIGEGMTRRDHSDVSNQVSV